MKCNYKQLSDYLTIYRAAKNSEDETRCMVAPHPDLNEKLKVQLKDLRDHQPNLLGMMLRATEPDRVGFNDGTIIPPQAFRLGTAMSVIRSAAAMRAPLRGVVRVIVVLVDFDDQHMIAGRQHFEDLFFSQGVIPTKSVREYYQEVTHGLIDIQGEVVGPFRMPQSMATYSHGSSGIGGTPPNAATMARDAVRASDASVNFAPYDNDGNGYVDAFIVIHAGPAAEVTGNPNHIWSHKWVLDGGELGVDGVKVYAYLTVPEDAKIGVCCHELGHLLFGFPDLYDTTNASEGIGNWCLMAAGSWGGGGDTPVHPSAWCKANQGWVSVQNQTSSSLLSIPDVKNDNTVYRLWKNGGASNEYFLMENRQRAKFDASLPEGGLLIWHIDETIPGNTNRNHYKVALLQADGRKDLENNTNRGDAGDCYPGSSGNTSLTASTNPNSKAYAGGSSSVEVTNISPSQNVMTAKVRVSGGGNPFHALAVPAARALKGSAVPDDVEGRIAALEGEMNQVLQAMHANSSRQ